MQDFEIIPANAEDCGAIAGVHIASWRAAYRNIFSKSYLESLSVSARETGWRHVLGEGKSALLVAREGGNILGFVSSGPCRDPDCAPSRGEIWALYVHPDHWLRGVGRTLWLAANAALRERGYTDISLWVLEDNARAVSFYRTAGFQRDPIPGRKVERGGVQATEIRMIRPSAS